uniref:Ig-like domain-containing protein n=1 Tax=Mus spicilegus TaxID=10103 RepID=A0A8C6GCH7_MUSSI
MGARLSWPVLICFIFHILPGSFVAGVTQTPRYLVKEKGQKAHMSCSPEKWHTAFYWYQQNQKQELTFLINFRNEEIMEQTDLVKKRFSAKCSSNSRCILEILSSEEDDSALYLCASSLYTALKCTSPSMHKTIVDTIQEAGETRNGKAVTETS